MRNELYDLVRCLKDSTPFESGDVGAQELLRAITTYCNTTDKALVLKQLCEVSNTENDSSDSALSILMTLFIDNFTDPNFRELSLDVVSIIRMAFQECDPENIEKVFSQINERRQNCCYLLANKLNEALRIDPPGLFAGVCDIFALAFSRCKKEIWIKLLFDTSGSSRGASGLFWLINALVFPDQTAEKIVTLTKLINMAFQAADGKELLLALTNPCKNATKTMIPLNMLIFMVKKMDDLDSPLRMSIFYLLAKLDPNALPKVIKDFIRNYQDEIRFHLGDLVLRKKIPIGSGEIDAVIALLQKDKVAVPALTNTGLFPAREQPMPPSSQSVFPNCTPR